MPGLMDPSGYKPPERKPKKYPVKGEAPKIESIPVKVRYKCDADNNCDYAQYMIVTKMDLPIYMCGHHFTDNVDEFVHRGYDIRKIK